MKKIRVVLAISAFLLAVIGVFATELTKSNSLLTPAIKPNEPAGPCNVTVSVNCGPTITTACTFTGEADDGEDYVNAPVYDQDDDCEPLYFN